MIFKCEDINFEKGIVTINKTTQRINHVIIEDTPKNNSSIRKVYISNPTIEIMKEYKIYYDNIKDQLGDKWLGSKKVFTTVDGDYMHTDTARTTFKKFLIKYNLPIINFHALRHTSASLQLSRGISIVDISKRLGHSETSTTLNIYSHAFNSGNEKIVNEFNNIFNTKES